MRDTCWIRPAPPQDGHATGDVPGAAPVPPQGAHERAARTLVSTVVPRAASREVDLDVSGDVGASRRARPGARAAAEQRLAEERGEDVGEAAEVGVHRRVAAASEPGVAEAVVRRPPLGIGQHLVRLGDGAEAELRVGCLADVRVELAGELPERPLDLVVAGVPGDAEQLVVVLLRRRHQTGP